MKHHPSWSGGENPDLPPNGLNSAAEIEVEGAGRITVSRVATIGRSPDCEVCINVRSVSRKHARVFYEGGHFWLKDLGSANGTSVNGTRVGLQMLSDGDELCFGEAAAVFRGPQTAAGPAPLGEDPLSGLDPGIPDGTPTGVLKALARETAGRVGAECIAKGQEEDGTAELQVMTRKIESLETENERLRCEIAECRSARKPASSGGDSAAEVARLRQLVSRLERALADSNIRIRNLQARLEK